MRSFRVAVVVLLFTGALGGLDGAHAGVLFEDDFERDVPTSIGYIGSWDGPPNPAAMYLTDTTAHSGGRSVELKYVPGSTGATFMYRHFPGQDQVYYRLYQKWSPGFVWEPSSTKMVTLRPEGGYPQ